MNKVIESYNRLVSRVYKYDHIEDVYKDLENLGELIDKATPKPVVTKKYIKGVGACPNCGAEVVLRYDVHYCHTCGQRLKKGVEEDE